MKAWFDRQGMTAASARCYAAEGRLAYAPVTTWLRTDAIQAGPPALDPIWLTEVARLGPDALAIKSKLPLPASLTEERQLPHSLEDLDLALVNACHPLLLLLECPD